MILSHTHRFIVFKTRKTGGTSFEIALSKYLAEKDVVTPIAADDEAVRSSLGYRGPQNDLVTLPGARPVKFYNHIGAAHVRLMVPPAIFEGYVKAAIVRNPFDFVVSWYYWERARNFATSREDFRNWLAAHFQQRAELEAQYLRGMRPNPGVFLSNRHVTHVGGTCAMDVMLRYERLQEDAAAFAARVGLPVSLGEELGAIRTKGGYRPATATARDMFEGFSDGQRMIVTCFGEEIERFGYRLG